MVAAGSEMILAVTQKTALEEAVERYGSGAIARIAIAGKKAAWSIPDAERFRLPEHRTRAR